MKLRPFYVFLRRLLAALSLLAMTSVFFVPAAARWLGWFPRLQLVPAILAGAILELIVLAAFVLLFGRLYCTILCPLGIVQDFFRFCFGWVPGRTCATGRVGQIVRYGILALFVLAIPLGLTGLLEPYGIYGRSLSVGIRRAGEPSVVTVAWALSLVGFILLMTFVRPRWWCNRLCPVGTFLGIFSRVALVRVRIDAANCVKCGRCAAQCEVGALVCRPGETAKVDSSSCVLCGKCAGACAARAIKFTGIPC